MNKDKSYQDGYKAGQDDMYEEMQEKYRSEKYLTEKDVKKIVATWNEVDKRNDETIKILQERPSNILLNHKPFTWLNDNDLRKVFREWLDDGIESDKDVTHLALMIQTALVNKNEINHE